MKDYFIKRYGIDSSKAYIAYPGYDPLIFSADGREEASALIRQRHGIERENIIGFISSGNLKKRGIDILTEAVAKLSPDVSAKTTLLMVGKDDKADEYKTGIEQGNSNIQVITVGAVGDVNNYYRACSLLLHPAHIEEFGMTILEAMACGTVVLTSRMSGASEVFSDDLGVYLTDTPDAFRLAENIELLLRDEALRARLSDSAAKIAPAYSWDNYFKKLMSIYESCGIVSA